ncbi:MAG: S41 family peptidase [Clostridiales bacterium]|nr:S41 family peptidase [Clostridiales bacterium]
MKRKTYSGRQLLLSALGGAAAALALVLLAVWLLIGPQGASLLEGLAIVQTRFVGEYEKETAVDSALSGMVAGLGDRWSYYLSAEEYEAQTQRRSNTYVGIGVTIEYTDERGLRIRSVVEGGPAAEAGLVSGEIITAVNGTSLAGENREDGVSLISGETGTRITLTVLGEDGLREVSLTLADIEVEPVHAELLDNGTGYVKLDNFYSHSAEKLNKAVDELLEQGADSLLFDMRENGGGYVGELTDMLDHLLPEGIIFRTQSKLGLEETVESDAACVEVPMAVLVNANTYSAAEFFAAELQEAAGARIVGVETSGKGYSQQAIALSNGGALNLSTARYTTGEGVSLIGTGVTLDAEVALSDEELAQLQAGNLSHEEDAQVRKALELLGK